MRQIAAYILAGLGLVALLLWCRYELPYYCQMVSSAAQDAAEKPHNNQSLLSDSTSVAIQSSESGSAHISSAGQFSTQLETVTAFDQWFSSFRRGEFVLDSSNLERGLDLVRQRREVIKELIKTDPARALSLAIPRGLRDELPLQMASQMEQWVEGVGDLEVLIGCSGACGPSETIRRVKLGNQIYDVYVYGRRLTH